MIGTRLAHYDILEKLGSGGMGDVYRGRDSRLGRDVAIKVLPPEVANDAERRARFEREATVVAGLKHPNIVTLHSIEEDPAGAGVHFLTMELVEGSTLGAAIPSAGCMAYLGQHRRAKLQWQQEIALATFEDGIKP